MKRVSLRRRAPLRAKTQIRRYKPLRRTPAMAATDAQRAAVAGRNCIVCGSDRRIDPAHLIPRSLGVLCPGWAVLGPAVSGAGRGRRHGSLALCVVGRFVLSGWGRSVVMVLVAGTSRTFEAFQIAPGTPAAYWTVVDEDFVPVALADDYLRELRFGRGRAVSTTKAYAENLALFFGWASRAGCAVENGPRLAG
jgi:hypothetical protein